MMLLTVLLLIWRTYASSAAQAENLSPVLIWGENVRHHPSLNVMTQKEFRSMLQPFVHNHMLMAFAENELTADDFTCMDNRTHKPCFLYMRQITNYTYFARVEKPLATFHSLHVAASYAHYPNSYQLYGDISCRLGTAHTIYLPHAPNVSRVDEIELHDRFITNVWNRTFCNTVFLFMAGNRPQLRALPMPRSRSDDNDDNDDNDDSGAVLSSDRFIIYYSAASIRYGNGEEQDLTAVVVQAANNDDTMEVTLTTVDSKNLVFELESFDGYYIVKRFTYEALTFRPYDMEAPYTFSYYCALLELAATKGDRATLRFENLQFELRATADAELRFSEPWHCTGFMSVGIVSGLLVMALLCSIVFCGVCWIMDLHTCDRYENPKGKQLVITVKDAVN